MDGGECECMWLCVGGGGRDLTLYSSRTEAGGPLLNAKSGRPGVQVVGNGNKCREV